MRRISLVIVALIFMIASSQNVTPSEEHRCKCDFVGQTYEATGYFAGTCTYSMDPTRTKCTLRRSEDYSDIKESLIKSDRFRDPRELYVDIVPRALGMYNKPQDLLIIDASDFFSFLMRSSYLAAPFLNDKQKVKIDNLLYEVLVNHGLEMLRIFAGLHPKDREKKFTLPSREIYVAKATVKYTVDLNGKKILIYAEILPQIGD